MSHCSLYISCHASPSRILLLSLLTLTFIYYYISYLHYTYADYNIYLFPKLLKRRYNLDTHKVNSFIQSWCRQKRSSIDWEEVIKPCRNQMEWGTKYPERGLENRTSALHSYITLFDIRPAGEFSRISIQTVTLDRRLKSFGGDSWRVQIRGPSSIPVTITDYDNGTYEFFFLVMEPGKYEATIILDYSLCDGFKDPPKDWFIKGNAQGKFQHPHVLPGYENPFLLELLQGGTPVVFNVKSSSTPLFRGILAEYGHPDNFCREKCSQVYSGYGRWINGKWTPYIENQIKPLVKNASSLWIYADSIGQLFHKAIINTPLCTELFKKCLRTYNWVYNIQKENLTWAKIENDSLNFSKERILSELSQVLYDPRMNNQSVLLLNLGLHFVQNINFIQFQDLLEDVITLVKSRNISTKGSIKAFRGHLIWRTTTAMSRERYGDPSKGVPHAKVLRFLTNQRTILFNAYANSLMCRAHVGLIDVFPLTDSYPQGTGLPGNMYDGVHYTDNVFKSVESILTKLVGGNYQTKQTIKMSNSTFSLR